jgi:hypothetical protein
MDEMIYGLIKVIVESDLFKISEFTERFDRLIEGKAESNLLQIDTMGEDLKYII